MLTLVNLNTYLGGGETLLVRLANKMPKDEVQVITVQDSFISKSLTDEKLVVVEFESYFQYLYLNQEEKRNVRSRIKDILLASNARHVMTFCLRDLIMIWDTIMIEKIQNVKLAHLFLHPLDHLYACQSVLSKVALKLGCEPRYRAKQYFKLNSSIIKSLDKSNSLIFMNDNVRNRVCTDLHINKDKSIVPLPSIEPVRIEPRDFESCNSVKRIIWVGRIVDFKIPAVCAMIKFVKANNGYEFDIWGDGAIDKVKKLTNLKAHDNNIVFKGKLDYNKFGEIAKQYDIGYAMGTSLIELAAQKLPTIVALAQPTFQLFDDSICGNLFCLTGNGNIGDDLYVDEKGVVSIKQVMDAIALDKKQVANACYKKAIAEFSIDSNLQRYLDTLTSSEVISADQPPIDLKVSLIRKLFNKLS